MSLFNLGFAVNMLATHDVTITRYSAATYDSDGRAIARTSTNTAARGSVQPASGSDLKRLAEGTNVDDIFALFVTAQVLVADEAVIGFVRYQVEQVADWSAAGGYSRAIVRKLDAREI